jgi:class 3 adenylate cyclase
MKDAMERHDAILRDAVVRSDGRVVKITGDGMMAVFSSAADGVKACLEAAGAAGRGMGRDGSIASTDRNACRGGPVPKPATSSALQ